MSGNKMTAPQSSVQLPTKGNAAIARNSNAKFNDKKGSDTGDKWKQGKPNRVVQRCKRNKHSKYAPEEGCRYIEMLSFVSLNISFLDMTTSTKLLNIGLRRVQQVFCCGDLLWQDDDDPALWTKAGKKRIEEGDWVEMQYPENYHDTQAKLSDKENQGEEKAKGKKRKNSDKVEPLGNSKLS